MTNYVHFNKNWKLANKKLQIIVLSDQFAKFGTFHGMCFIFFPDQRMLKNDLFPQNFIFRLIFAKRHSRKAGETPFFLIVVENQKTTNFHNSAQPNK